MVSDGIHTGRYPQSRAGNTTLANPALGIEAAWEYAVSRTIEVVTLTVDQVRDLIGEAVAKALDDQHRRAASNAQTISANQASRLAKCRRSDLTAALVGGGLRGTRVGNRWRTTAGEVAAWNAAGRPLSGGC